MRIKVKKLHKDAKVPQCALEGDSGMDLCSIKDAVLKPGERVSCETGIAIKIPSGFTGLVWDKSGLSHKFGIKTLGGVFDSNYIGEYKVGLINLSTEDFEIKKGQKIAQVIFQKIETPEIEEVKDLEETNRGGNGFGSTGVF